MVSGRRHLVSGRCRGRTEQFVGFIRACLVKYRTARTEYFEFQRKYEKCEYENIVLLERNTLLLLHRRRGRRRGRARGSDLAGKASQGSFLALRIGFSFHQPSLQNEMVARTPVCDWRLCRCVRVCFGSRLLSSRGGEQWTMQWHACPYKAVLTH